MKECHQTTTNADRGTAIHRCISPPSTVCVHSLCFLFLFFRDQAPNRPRRSVKADNALVVLRIAAPEEGGDELFVLLFVLGPAVVDLAERGRWPVTAAPAPAPTPLPVLRPPARPLPLPARAPSSLAHRFMRCAYAGSCRSSLSACVRFCVAL